MSDEEKDYENIPADEWDYDDGDLYDKLINYYEAFVVEDDDEDSEEMRQKVRDYLDAQGVEYAEDNMKEVLFEHAKPLVKKELADVLECVNLWFEWDENDQCFYEEVTCL